MNYCIVVSSSLKRGHTKSCNCLQKDVAKEVMTTHGKSDSSEYRRYHCAERRSRIIKRTPVWSNLQKIREIYENCPDGQDVDHIIPLKGKLVSGLHVPENLQYLPKSENYKKNNSYNPYEQQFTAGTSKAQDIRSRDQSPPNKRRS